VDYLKELANNLYGEGIMQKTSFENILGRNMVAFAALLMLAVFVTAFPANGFAASPKVFSSPEEASNALFAAVKDNNDDALMGILGAGKELVTLEDKGTDKLERERFVIKYQEMHRFIQEEDGSTVLYVGAENWPFPVPLRSTKTGVYFDSDSGAKEVLFRRIGQNEEAAVQAMHFLLQAEGTYRSTLHSDDVSSHYAARFVSTQWKQDGLYYGADSPIPDFMANAGIDGVQPSNNVVPYSGYYFRILTKQGKAAAGGAQDYVSNGELTGGVAFVAYPAVYEKCGVMTFIINQDDVVYAQDLGPDTVKIAQSMTRYNPGTGWQMAE
jgi:hypothetical protein